MPQRIQKAPNKKQLVKTGTTRQLIKVRKQVTEKKTKTMTTGRDERNLGQGHGIAGVEVGHVQVTDVETMNETENTDVLGNVFMMVFLV